MSSKYLVVKREAFDGLEKAVGFDSNSWTPENLIAKLRGFDLDDAEVIRQQDITAAPIFYCYASLMRSYAELPGQPEDRVERLHHAGDWAMNAAALAEKHPDRKYPD